MYNASGGEDFFRRQRGKILNREPELHGEVTEFLDGRPRYVGVNLLGRLG